MDEESFNKYFEDRYLSALSFYKKASSKYQKRHKLMQWASIFFSILTLAVAVLNSTKIPPIKLPMGNHVVIALSMIVAILIIFQNIFDRKKLREKFLLVYEQLKTEANYYQIYSEAYSNVDEKKRQSIFIGRIESILSEGNWYDPQSEIFSPFSRYLILKRTDWFDGGSKKKRNKNEDDETGSEDKGTDDTGPMLK